MGCRGAGVSSGCMRVERLNISARSQSPITLANGTSNSVTATRAGGPEMAAKGRGLPARRLLARCGTARVGVVLLARVDELLCDPELLVPVALRWERELAEASRYSDRCRPSLAMETYVRLMVLKHRCGWGYETLMRPARAGSSRPQASSATPPRRRSCRPPPPSCRRSASSCER